MRPKVKILFLIFLKVLAFNLSKYSLAQGDAMYTIKLPNRYLTPQATIDPLLLNHENQDSTNLLNGILQFFALPTGQVREQLSSKGIDIKEYLGGYAYYASFSGRLNFANIHNSIRYIGLLTKSDRISAQLYTRDIPEWAFVESKRIKIIVYFFDEITNKQASSILSKYTNEFELCADDRYYELKLGYESILSLAEESCVRWIEPGPQPFMPL